MKHLLTLTLFLGIAWGQSELHGYWHQYSGSKRIYVFKIYESNGRQFVEHTTYEWGAYYDDYRWKVDTSYKPSTKILYDPWFGESYTEHTNSTRTIKTEYILIDNNTLLRANSKYYRGLPANLSIK